MAEAVVRVLLQTLREPLVKEAILPFGVLDKVERLRNELQRMHAFLKHVEKIEAAEDDMTKVLARQIRDLAHEAENVIDMFVHQAAQLNRRGFIGRLANQTLLMGGGELLGRHKVGPKIEEINNKFSDIGKGSGDRRKGEFFKAIIIGGEEQRCMVFVVGMDGVVKTTLVRKVYRQEDVKGCFEGCFACRAWVCVSQSYRVSEILRCMIDGGRASSRGVQDMDERRLKEVLLDHLSTKRYLIVLDDLWDIHAWVCIRDSLRDVKNGSRVLITTRNIGLAEMVDRNTIHHLQPLPKDESRELFCRKAFVKNNGGYPAFLTDLAMALLKDVEACPWHLLSLEVFCPQNLEEENFMGVVTVKGNMASQRARRVAFHGGIASYVSSHVDASNVRSFFVYQDLEKISIQYILRGNLIRVLMLEKIQIEYLPKELGNLTHLRFLSFGQANYQKYHMSSQHLQETFKILETIDLRISRSYQHNPLDGLIISGYSASPSGGGGWI
ncbi:hypothetical protein AMTR_s00071p00016730 [Amborella trichopoda]|uniref:NB-ARC domain-containing protein n=1 Tax=Amborella trichopoda TaxID=13333 RepID=U5DC93_AMBTC|nr:hypothetical protein AMTR_s00071p00016730 [Amborella trichopoda]